MVHRVVQSIATALLLVCIAPGANAQVERPTSASAGIQMPRPATPYGRTAVLLPRPGDMTPEGILTNLQALVEQTQLDRVAEIPALRSGVRVVRVLRVRAEAPRGGYVVIELDDFNGKPVANLMMNGDSEFMGLESAQDGGRGRALSLDDGTSRVRRKLGAAPRATEYVHFSSTAEPGLSWFRPLVRAMTDKGDVFLNSRGEAYVDPSSELLPPEARGVPARPKTPGERDIRSAGIW